MIPLLKTTAILIISAIISGVLTGFIHKWEWTDSAERAFDATYLACLGTVILFQLFWMQK